MCIQDGGRLRMYNLNRQQMMQVSRLGRTHIVAKLEDTGQVNNALCDGRY